MNPNEASEGPAAIYEPRLWQDHGWTARVIKNNDDEGWAVEMIKAGQEIGRAHV